LNFVVPISLKSLQALAGTVALNYHGPQLLDCLQIYEKKMNHRK
jgi:hypothetical protein